MPWLAPPGVRSFGHAGVSYAAVEVEPGVFIFDIPGPLSAEDQETMIAHGLTPTPLRSPSPSTSPPPAGSGEPPPADPPAGPPPEPPPESGWAEDDIDTMSEAALLKVAEAIDFKVDGRWSEARLRTNLAAELRTRGLLIAAEA